jgi:hypothetical protein
LVGPVFNFLTNTILKARDITGISPVLIDTGSELAREIIGSLFSQVRNLSLIVIGMGFAVIITAAVLKAPTSTEQEGQGEGDEKEEIPDSDPTSDEEDLAEPGDPDEKPDIEAEEENDDGIGEPEAAESEEDPDIE